MDSLFKRYADPFTLLNIYIRNKSLCKFFDKYISIVDEEKLYDFYLHKVDNMTFLEFKDKTETNLKTVTKKEKVKTINESFEILNGFVVEEVRHGTV